MPKYSRFQIQPPDRGSSAWASRRTDLSLSAGHKELRHCQIKAKATANMVFVMVCNHSNNEFRAPRGQKWAWKPPTGRIKGGHRLGHIALRTGPKAGAKPKTPSACICLNGQEPPGSEAYIIELGCNLICMETVLCHIPSTAFIFVTKWGVQCAGVGS